MITLNNQTPLLGLAGTINVVAYTVNGKETQAGQPDVYRILGQGFLSTAPIQMYAPPGNWQAEVDTILLANTSGSSVAGIEFFVGGTDLTNQLTGTITIPANGTAAYANSAWYVYDGTGTPV